MKKLFLAVLVLCLGVPSFSADSICFEDPVAKKLLTDVEACEVNNSRLALCDSQLGIIRQAIKEEQAKNKALEKDKDTLVQASDKYRELAQRGNDALNDCESSKPSRLTWFALGSLASILALVGIAAATK